MTGDGSSTLLGRGIVLQLLDPTYGRPIKNWNFVGRAAITIGREPGRDVEINDPYVSRLHAELVLQDENWTLVSKGRNGVMVESKPITELVLGDQETFRLGPTGPALRFSLGQNALVQPASATVCFDLENATIPICHVDESKMREEVSEITASDYFQRLQDKVHELRRGRQAH